MIAREIVDAMPPAMREDWGERAAIVEYCGGYSRDEAERVALVMIRQARARPG